MKRRRRSHDEVRSPRKTDEERKDFLIQARVPRELDDVLKKEARKRRLSVSHLIRNVLEDTYKLVDGVISEVDNLVHDSVELGGRVRREAEDIARAAVAARDAVDPRPAPEPVVMVTPAPAVSAASPEPVSEPSTPSKASDISGTGGHAIPREATFEQRTADVYAWNPVVLHRAARCERCFTALERGTTSHLGLSQDPTTQPRWLCAACLAAIASL